MCGASAPTAYVMTVRTSRCRLSFRVCNSCDPCQAQRPYGRQLLSPGGEGTPDGLDSVKSRSGGGELDCANEAALRAMSICFY